MPRKVTISPPRPVMIENDVDNLHVSQLVQRSYPTLYHMVPIPERAEIERLDKTYVSVAQNKQDNQNHQLISTISHIFADQTWLKQQLDDGTSFLIIDQSIDMIATPDSESFFSVHARASWPTAPCPCVLVFDSNGNVMMADENFLPGRILQGTSNDRVTRAVKVPNVKPALRRVEIGEGGEMLSVALPQAFVDARQGLWLDARAYLPWVELKSVAGEIAELGLAYLFLTSNGVTMGIARAQRTNSSSGNSLTANECLRINTGISRRRNGEPGAQLQFLLQGVVL